MADILIKTSVGHERILQEDDILFDMNDGTSYQNYELTLRFSPLDIIENFPDAHEAVSARAEDLGTYCELGLLEQKASFEIMKAVGKQIAHRYAEYVGKRGRPINMEVNTDSNCITTDVVLPELSQTAEQHTLYPEAAFRQSIVNHLEMENGWYAMLSEPETDLVCVFGLYLPAINLYYRDIVTDTTDLTIQELVPIMLDEPIQMASSEAVKQYSSLLELTYEWKHLEQKKVAELDVKAVYVKDAEIVGYLPARLDAEVLYGMRAGFMTDKMFDNLVGIHGRNVRSMGFTAPVIDREITDYLEGNSVCLFVQE